MQCSGSASCPMHFHPICAWYHGMYARFDPSQQVELCREPSRYFRCFCPTHTPEAMVGRRSMLVQRQIRGKYRDKDWGAVASSILTRLEMEKRDETVAITPVLKPEQSVTERTTEAAPRSAKSAKKSKSVDVYKDGVCAICFQTNSELSPIRYCDRCCIGTHPECYRLDCMAQSTSHSNSTKSSSPWVCDLCKEHPEPVRCKLCPRVGGSYARSVMKGQWVHQACAEWVPDVLVTADRRVDTSKVHKSRWGRRCYLCKGKQGCIVGCDAPKCGKFFHPLCALLHSDSRSPPFLGITEEGEVCSNCHQHPPMEYKWDAQSGEWIKIPPPFGLVALRCLKQSFNYLRTLAFYCRRRGKIKARLLDALVCEFDAERALSEPRAGPMARVTRGRRSSGAATTPSSSTRPLSSTPQQPLLAKRSVWVEAMDAPDPDGEELEWVRMCCSDEAAQCVARHCFPFKILLPSKVPEAAEIWRSGNHLRDMQLMDILTHILNSQPSDAPSDWVRDFTSLPSREEWPEYYATISAPICIDDIFRKIQNYEYDSVEDAVQDWELLASNSQKFNAEGSAIHKHAGHIRAVCRSRHVHWQQLCRAVADAEGGDRAVSAGPSTSDASKLACMVCGSAEREDQILLCDNCDAHCHIDCMGYPEIPEHSWYCKSCVHAAAEKGAEIAVYYNNDCAWHWGTVVECTTTLKFDQLVKMAQPRHLIWFMAGGWDYVDLTAIPVQIKPPQAALTLLPSANTSPKRPHPKSARTISRKRRKTSKKKK